MNEGVSILGRFRLRHPSGNRHYGVYRCQCGKMFIANWYKVKHGRTKSCGCIAHSLQRAAVTKHGLSGTVEYGIWQSMIQRCINPKTINYYLYGGRGIYVCDRWRNFENFYADMGKRPSSDHSIDRIDSERSYEPTNCRWATRKEQQRNRRVSIFVLQDGTRLNLRSECERLGIPYRTAYARYKLGYPVSKVLATTSFRGLRGNGRVTS